VTLAGLLCLFVPRRYRRSTLWPMMGVILFASLVSIGCGGSSGTPKNTLLAISSSNTKAASGASVTLTATLSALGSNPTGTVTFYDGATALGSPVTVTQATASMQISTLSVGAHTISATYSGDKHNGSSKSIALTQVITGSSTLTINATAGTLTHSVSLPVTIQ
jgi:hypothetical protein